ncbi:phosphonate ABC transporter, permease protein PhnE [Aerococcus urinae]|uniref:Phosphonate ABC transporter, permease protein PhnE n=2 Tax=Bacillati TaxID=1783272 RepID=A0A7T2RQT5_9LACT|nr:phosphonate ABC transporter, permease protein PhnE [Aerococcus urinae]AMB95049.1 phosphonate ABC transporter permease [Aerococcus urinae]MCY3031759.1 phosphonate ABC transporter, permease protein PhnE [Aerococcus urinae]MCY3037247.1 phosphonate ABC transporter, permease protein PhnE [Aerococcus urinae]MCY3043806.1 phosphonate ABC transporter, permease protein PhnE [Aerococcus urinae]MCY3046549.1 phosphonate ABC transporter, permease protein PhnE [Aerococcus urinae]
MTDSIQTVLDKEPNYRAIQGIITVLVLLVLFWSSSVIDFSNYSQDGWAVAGEIISGVLHPDMSMLTDFSSSGLWFLLFETVCIAFVGTLIGGIISLPLAFLSSSNVVPAWLAAIFRVVIMMLRTVPAIVYGLMFIRVTGPGPAAGVLTMTFTSIGMLTKLFSETIADLNTDILEAFRAMGTTTMDQIMFGIIPQLSASFLSTLIYRFDMNIRDATTLGLVGAGGIGAPLLFAINSYRWNQVGAILIALILLVFLVEAISTRLRQYLAYGHF